MEEVFVDLVRKDIKKGAYRISNYGRVWSELTHSYLKVSNFYGNYVVNVQSIIKTNVGFVSARKSISKLVAEHFIDNPENYKYVGYINGDKSNFKANNLKWVKSHIATNRTKSKLFSKTITVPFLKKDEDKIFDKTAKFLDIRGFKPYLITEPITKKKTFSQFYLSDEKDWFLGVNASETNYEVIGYSDKAKRLEAYAKKNKLKLRGSLGDCLATINSLNTLKV